MTFETIKLMFITLMEFVVFTAHRFVGVEFTSCLVQMGGSG